MKDFNFFAEFDGLTVISDLKWSVGNKATFFVNGKKIERKIYNSKDDICTFIKGVRFDYGNFKSDRDLEYAYKNLSEVTIEDGVARWNSNNRVVPEEIAKWFAVLTSEVNEEKCKVARDSDNADFFKGYHHKLTDEEKFEMNAAFGPGKKIVNIITGESYTTR